MKYSIIIPALNEDKLLPSILKQLSEKEIKIRFEYEIILSDGGSSDKTVELALPFADIIKVHTSEEKQNIAKGRNEGARFASGDILIFINADVLFPDVRKFFLYLEENFNNKEYLAFTCFVKVFPQEEIIADRFYHFIYNRFFYLLNDIGGGMGRGECQVVRKDVFEKLSGYNEEMAAGEDLDLFRRIKKLGKILFSKDICIYESPRRYRKYGYSYITLSWIKNGLSVLFTNKSVSKHWEQVR